MRLLFITQKVDKNDDILGFIHRWLEVFAVSYEHITVICLYKGEVALPENITVLSLGKEDGISRMKYIKRFYTYIFNYRKMYDTVFVHMNAEYVVLGTWLWHLLGKKVSLWYNHTYGNWKGSLAFRFADILFHTSPFAFSAGRKKSVRMPAGIDTEMFKKDTTITASKNSILSVGRISAVKNIDTLIKAMQLLDNDMQDFTLDIYGSPDPKDATFYKKITTMSYELQQKNKVEFQGSRSNFKMPPVYNAHEIFINLTPQGNYDKTILEAMSCERISLVSSKAFVDILPPECLFQEKDSTDLSEKIKYIFNLSPEQKASLGTKLRKNVIETNSLVTLSERLYTHLQ